MSGIDEINIKFNNKIQDVLQGCPDYIMGFANFISNMAYKSRYIYILHVKKFCEWLDKPIKQVTFDDFSNYIALQRMRDDGTPNTTSYQIVVYSAIKSFCNYLAVSGRIDKNYMQNVKRPKFKETQETISKREVGYLSRYEIEQALSYFDNKIADASPAKKGWCVRDKAIFLLFLNTGMRSDALLSINLMDIDFENRQLSVTDKGSKVKKYTLSEGMCKMLKEWITLRQELLRDPSIDALFITRNNARMSYQNLCDSIKRNTLKAVGREMSPHKLRATYGTQLYDATHDLYFVQDCMGHNNPKTTELYIRDKKQNEKIASNIMDKLTFGE